LDCLTEETGNFKEKGGLLGRLFGGKDPRKNFFHPTSEQSYQVGQAIAGFKEKGATTVLDAPPVGRLSSCENQSILCCFGRDRQSRDNNGNCKRVRCDDADPANNSNLCYVKDPLTSYPNQEEGPIHCHGFAWTEDPNDPSFLFRYNSLAYVSVSAPEMNQSSIAFT
jgi:hypothetical protein